MKQFAVNKINLRHFGLMSLMSLPVLVVVILLDFALVHNTTFGLMELVVLTKSNTFLLVILVGAVGFHVLYNVISLTLVLSELSAFNHALFNITKRVLVVVALYLLNFTTTTLSATNLISACLCIVNSILKVRNSSKTVPLAVFSIAFSVTICLLDLGTIGKQQATEVQVKSSPKALHVEQSQFVPKKKEVLKNLHSVTTDTDYRWNEGKGNFLVWGGDYSNSGHWGLPVLATDTAEKRPFVSDVKTLKYYNWSQFLNITFTETGQIKSFENQCFTVGSSLSYVRLQNCTSSDHQKFRYLLLSKKIESVAYPGRCISFNLNGFYHGATFGYLNLRSCMLKSRNSVWGYRFGPSPGVGAGSKDALQLIPVDTIIVKPAEGPRKNIRQTFKFSNGMLVVLKDWRYAHFRVPITVNEPIDCYRLNNSKYPISDKLCKTKKVPFTCEDYNKLSISKYGTNYHYDHKVKEITQWWNQKNNYMKHVDFIVNGGFFDVRHSNEFRKSPITYTYPCAAAKGLMVNNGYSYSRSNDYYNSSKFYVGKLDALLILENKNTEKGPSYINEIKVLNSEEVDKLMAQKYHNRSANIVSCIILARNRTVLSTISEAGKPSVVAARTILGLTHRHKMIFFVGQNGKVTEESPNNGTSYNSGVDLYSVATWMLKTFPEVIDIVSLGGSDSSQAAIKPPFSDHLKHFHHFKDNEGQDIVVTLPGDIHENLSVYQPIPTVLMISAIR